MDFKSKQVSLLELIEVPVQTGFQVRPVLRSRVFGKRGAVSFRGKSYKLIQVKDTVRGIWQDINSKGLETIVITEKKSKFMKKYLLEVDDVLYLSKLNPGAFRYRGPIGATLPVAHFYILRPKVQLVDPDYLCWVLNQSWTVGHYVQKHLVGSALPFVTKESLLGFKIPLPTLSIQKKIIYLLKLRAQEKALQKELDNKKNILLNKALRKLL